jgi:hypothetical protein
MPIRPQKFFTPTPKFLAKVSDMVIGGQPPRSLAQPPMQLSPPPQNMPGGPVQSFGGAGMGGGAGISNPAMKKGGKVKSASSRADGIAKRGKTKGKMY